MQKRTLYWLCQTAGWGTHLLNVYFLAIVLNYWVYDFGWYHLLRVLIGLVCSHLMRTVIIKSHLLEKNYSFQIFNLSMLSILFSIISGVLHQLIVMPFGLFDNNNSGSFFKEVLVSFFGFLWLLAPWNLIYFLYHYVEKIRQQQTKILNHERYENELSIQKLESEKSRAEFQQKASEMEMQALRSQMNPHFVFNCLSSINHFVIKNETEAASGYLTKFSRLIRMVLNYSTKKQILLEDELEMLQLYLDMEKLRFKDSFEYTIIYDRSIDAGSIYIPPLLFQPFAENAIWHGLMNKEGKGFLDIEMHLEDEWLLKCLITDNGVGRKKADELKQENHDKRKSVGLAITKQRLALLNGDKAKEDFYEVQDLVDENGDAIGTRVCLKIRYSKFIEEQTCR